MPDFKPLANVALYIHIPFCRSKCFYCDFFSVAGADTHTMHEVVGETVTQGRLMWERLGKPAIQSVYIGGGTPSCLPLAELERLFAFIRDLDITPVDFEFTLEANPESLQAPFLQLCRDYGVNRLSAGIQSCQANQLRLLGRLATPQINRQALELLQNSWSGRLNLDLIVGLPQQTEATIREDLLQVLANRPGHLSVYALTVEDGTVLQQKLADGELALGPEEVRDELWFYTAALLREQGFVDYEISNFALPGEECRHNLTYWELCPYLGLGPGAVSTLPLTNAGGTEVVRLQNPCHIPDFLAGAGEEWRAGYETVDVTDFLIENLMMGFRLKRGISKAIFSKRFGVELPGLLPDLWTRWQERGYLHGEEQAAYRLTAQGRLFLNSLVTEVIGLKATLSDRLAATRLNWP